MQTLARHSSTRRPPGAPSPRRGRRARGWPGKPGFTLIELLAVVAIIALLVSMLMPSLTAAKALGRRTVCLNNVRAIGLATHCYIQESGRYPPAWQSSQCRWMDLIKPYVQKSSEVYRCPDDPMQIHLTWDADIVMSYGINTFRFAGKEHCFWYVVKGDAVRRPTQVIIFADCTPGKYYCGGGSTFSDPVKDVDYRHAKGSFSACFCDGHAEAMRETKQHHWDASQ